MVAYTQHHSEYEVFRRAYLDWYEQPAPDRRLVYHFVRYLFYQETPVWVRHYVRQVQPRCLSYTGTATDATTFVYTVVSIYEWCAVTFQQFFGQVCSDTALTA